MPTKAKTKKKPSKKSVKKSAKKPAQKPTQKPAQKTPQELPDKACAAIFAGLAQANPNPKGELNYTNPYTLLVAVVLSAQATDKGVNSATAKLFSIADSPQKMLRLSEAQLRDQIKTIGLYRTKAKNVLALSKILLAKHGGQVPEDHESLVALPGVGRKTANVVRNIAFGAETIAVDTHVFRVARRTGLAQGTTPEAIEKRLLERVPKRYLPKAHHWLILHGRYTCTARAPKCSTCPVFSTCLWDEKGDFS